MPPPAPGKGVARRGPMIDSTLLTMVAMLLGLCALAYGRGGTELATAGISEGFGLLVRFALLIVVAFLVAGVAQKLVPQEWVRSALGEGSGMRGILLASAAGAITPSGPFVSLYIELEGKCLAIG